MDNHILQSVEQGHPFAELNVKVCGPSAEGIKLITDVPMATVSKYRLPYAHVCNVRRFLAMFPIGRNAMMLDRADVRWDTDVGVYNRR